MKEESKEYFPLVIRMKDWNSRTFSYVCNERLIYYICNARIYPAHHEKGRTQTKNWYWHRNTTRKKSTHTRGHVKQYIKQKRNTKTSNTWEYNALKQIINSHPIARLHKCNTTLTSQHKNTTTPVFQRRQDTTVKQHCSSNTALRYLVRSQASSWASNDPHLSRKLDDIKASLARILLFSVPRKFRIIGR